MGKVTGDMIVRLIQPHINDPETKNALGEAMRSMGIKHLPEAVPDQYDELYERFQAVIAGRRNTMAEDDASVANDATMENDTTEMAPGIHIGNGLLHDILRGVVEKAIENQNHEGRRNAALQYAVKSMGTDTGEILAKANEFYFYLGGLTPVPENHAPETATGYPPYLDRMIAEEAELAYRVEKAHGFMRTDDFAVLEKQDQALLETQVRFMEQYLGTLRERVERETAAHGEPLRSLFDDNPDGPTAA